MTVFPPPPPPPPPPVPPPRDDRTNVKEGPRSETETWNIVPRPSNAKMSYPSSVAGDTQPISQSVYDSILRKGDAATDCRSNNVEYAEVGITQKTLDEGDTGHLDLLAEFDDTANLQHDDTEAEVEDDEIGNSPSTRYEQFPESQRFLDHTPAALRKTLPTTDGDTTTPSGSRNPFPASNKTPSTVMALSQLFNATQAASSPIAHGPAPEPSSDMPSPNIPIQPRFTATATTPTSPLQMTSSVSRPQFLEPQTSYVSLKESQATREKLTRSIIGFEPDNTSDDGFDKEDILNQRRVRQKRIEEEVRKQFANVTAPTRIVNGNNTQKVASLSPTLERQPPKTTIGTHPISFPGGGPSENPLIGNSNECDSEVETEQEDESHAPSNRGSQQFRSSGEEDKENVDNGFVQLSSQTSQAHNALSQVLDMERGPFKEIEHPMGISDSAAGHTRSDNLQGPLQETENDVRITKSPLGITNMPDALAAPVSQELGTTGEHVDREAPLSSPSFKSVIQSSPPARTLPFDVPVQDADENISSDQRTVIMISYPSRHGSRSRDQTTDPDGNLDAAITNSWNHSSADDAKKQQSLSSRVFETPAQTLRPDHNPQNTIPETSPSAHVKLFQDVLGSVNDDDGPPSSNNEEDDLPPVHHRSTAAQRMQFQTPKPPGRNTAGPVSTILSSPSGRVRRRLTEIAADESPRSAFPEVSLDDFGLMTAEDREFHTLVSEPEYFPAKRRRANDGRAIRTSAIRRSEFLVSNSSPRPSFVPESDTHDSRPPEGIVEDEPSAPKIQRNTPSQETQDNDHVQPAADPQSHIPEQVNGKIRSGHQIAHAVVITTPRNSSPSTGPGRKDSPDPLQSEVSIGIGVERSPQKSGQHATATNQVLAFFNGRPQGYFPATCVGTTERNGRLRYLILFEDSDAPDEIEAHGIKRLELRINDVVKIDSDNVPKIPFVVIGFKDRVELSATTLNSLKEPTPITDVYGYKSLVLKPRQPQNSRKAGVITVPISSIYLDKSLWAKFGGRPFTFTGQRNNITSSLYGPAPGFAGSSRCSSEANNLFGNMAFAVSYKDKEKQKKVEALIVRNGGRILDEGFDELFEQPLFKASTLGMSTKLNQRAELTGFTCLISDDFSRRIKYLQALALNLPCLNGRWVQDCVSKKQVLDWEFYLLAAGVSSFLDNSVRSRILTPYPPSDARLSQVVDSRSKLFAGQSVLLHMDRGKTAKERETTAAVIYALGPDRVTYVQDLETALNMLTNTQLDSHDQGWSWIYLGGRDAAAAARQSLVGLSKPGSTKSTAARGRGRSLKRPRSMPVAAGIADLVINGKKIRVLDNELLCQILILGRLLE